MEDIIALNNLYHLLTKKNEKQIIKRLIDKREFPFLINKDLILTSFDIGQGKKFITSYLNKVLYKLLKIEEDNYYNKKYPLIDTYNDDFNSDEEDKRFYAKTFKKYMQSDWIELTDEYAYLVLIRAQFFLNNPSPLKTQSLKTLNLYTEQQIDLLIKNHYKL